MAKKIYLLDTNVLVHDPHAIFAFEGALVGIPSTVLEELDHFKREGTDRGRNTREVIRLLDGLREQGSLGKGVKLDNGGTLRVLFVPATKLPEMPFKVDIKDNEILLIAAILKEEGYDVQFISKDINARVKADALGIHAQDYLSDVVIVDDFYKGWTKVPVPSAQLKKDMPAELDDLASSGKLEINEFVLLESQNNSQNYRIYRYLGGKRFLVVDEPMFKWPLKPRNAQQLMALNLLLDDTIECVSLFGPAGTGKTFLALLAGLHKVLVEDAYEKLLVARPVIPLGRDVGFLPGTLQEKLYTWMLPVYDNMELIVHSAGVAKHIQSLEQSDYHEQRDNYRGGGKRGSNGGNGGGHRHHAKHGRGGGRSENNYHEQEGGNWKRQERGALKPLDELVRRGKISLEVITYMRGRSIPYQFIVIDEVQNLTPHEVKTLVSRVGEGSKIILAGDPQQIDSPYLDFSSNGLVIASEKFKGQPIFGSVYLETTERSKLSQLAAEIL